MKVVFDKIASTTKNAKVAREALLSPEIPAQEGIVVAVRVIGTKSTYNSVEDLHGRMTPLNDGDILAGVLGSRRALRGYAGVVPDRVHVGDKLDILNLGGVIGRCTAGNPELGKPLQAEVLGVVLSFPYLGERTGVPATIRDNAVPWADTLDPSAPIVYVAGSCMQAGKTSACCEIIRVLSRRGRKVAAAKLTGVSLLRDTLGMNDRGAALSLSFTDAGCASTSEAVAVRVSKGLINALNKEKPDCLVVELGDGIMGEYGVQAILQDKELMAAGTAHVLCATDPVAAWGCAELYKNHFKLPVHVISGPATDNAVGKDFVEGRIGVPALNARLDPEALGAAVEDLLWPAVVA
ncbi:MAG: hypothetical protein HY928_16070 [Elusimicrobia bacterium]|nr:hypothetical protein [Elusimicrobiota bacterium]